MAGTRPSAPNRMLPLLFLAGTLIAAAGAGYFVLTLVNRSQALAQEAAKPKERISVVVALHDLYMGVPITDQDVIVTQLDPLMVPPENTFKSMDEIRGRTPRERILANEMIREERLARPDAGVGLNAIISPGKRALTVVTDTETAVAGLLQPGNYVDIIVTIRPENPDEVGGKWVSKTILQGIKLLAVGNSLSSQPPPPVDPKDKSARSPAQQQQRNLRPSITLELLPEEAEQLALASSQGELHVTLRTDTDFTQIENQGVTTAARIIGVTGNGEPVVPPDVRIREVAAPPPPTVETPAGPKAQVISGSKSTEVTFQPDGTTSEKSNNKNR